MTNIPVLLADLHPVGVKGICEGQLQPLATA